MMQEIRENALIERLACLFPRNPAQRNRLQESDAELVQLSGGSKPILAVTTDAIVEEIDSKLYTDFHLIGWMAVMANLSDLAAVGADPLGVLLSETLPHDMSFQDRDALQAGIRDACLVAGTSVLGGDTNFSDRLHIGGTAVGIIHDGSPMMRVGCRPGDEVYSTGPIGMGNAYAAARFAGVPPETLNYLPVARLHEGQTIRRYAAACMDTSDGLLATLDQLGRLNGVGFRLAKTWVDHIPQEALAMASLVKLPPWTLLAGPHGEFELVFTVRPGQVKAMNESLAMGGCPPLHLGTVCEQPGVLLDNWGFFDDGFLAELRNRQIRTASDVEEFRDFLLQMERTAQQSRLNNDNLVTTGSSAESMLKETRNER